MATSRDKHANSEVIPAETATAFDHLYDLLFLPTVVLTSLGLIVASALGSTRARLLLLTSVVLIVSRSIWQSWQWNRLSYSNGCSPPPFLPRPFWDVLGFTAMANLGAMMNEHRFFPAMLERFEKYGPTWAEVTPARQSIWTTDPKLVQHVFSTDSQNWGTRHRFWGFNEYCGSGFLTTDGAEHDAWRAFMMPLFNKKAISDHETFAQYVELMLEQIPRDGTTFDLQKVITNLYLDTSFLFLVGSPFGALSGDRSKGDKFMEDVEYTLQGGIIRLILGRRFEVLHQDPKWFRSINGVHGFVEEYVDAAIARQSKSDAETKDVKYNLLDAMVPHTKDREVLRFSVLQGLLALNDTTSHLIGNVMWALARNPAMWQEIRGEVKAQLQVNPELNFSIAGQIPLLNNIIDETLRLWPVFPFQDRRAYKETILPSGGGPDGTAPVYAPADSAIAINFVAIHRRKDIWGEDANEWKPERWNKLRGNLQPWVYIPFAGGQRACLGKTKALNEAGYVICRLAQEFERIDAQDDKPWVGVVKTTSGNKYGCLVSCTPAKSD